MKYGSLFSGIGGFDLGFDRAGMTCAYQVERDARAIGVLERHWPAVPRWKDIRDVRTDDLPITDVICGGFPCQDLSVAGDRAGLAGTRSGLWYEYHRILGALRPRYVVIENVPGLLSSHRGRDFAAILDGLVELGYRVAWRVLDTRYFHCPQRRERVFIVGSLGNGRSAEILFEPESLSGYSAPGREAGASVAGTLTAGAHPGGYSGRDADAGNLIPEPITFDYQAGVASRNDRTWIVDPPNRTRALIANRQLAVLEVPHDHAYALTAHHHRHTHEDTYIVADENDAQANHLIPVSVHQNQQGRLTTSAVAATLSGGGGIPGQGYAAALTSRGVRRLTPRERERLHGFPDDWTAYDAHGWALSDSARQWLTGNAVSVPVAHWLGARIVRAYQQ